MNKCGVGENFYKESDNITYTEVGFKETPASNTLFSKIRFDPTMSLHAGQFMRVSYELRVNLNPTNLSSGGVTPNPFPTFTGKIKAARFRKNLTRYKVCGKDMGTPQSR